MASFFDQIIQGTSSLLIFFLILAGTYEGFIFSCEFREKLLTNLWLKHFIGFGILFVFVVQFSATEKSLPRNLVISLVPTRRPRRRLFAVPRRKAGLGSRFAS